MGSKEKLLWAHELASLELYVLLNKRIRRHDEIIPDYVGFDVPDGFMVGMASTMPSSTASFRTFAPSPFQRLVPNLRKPGRDGCPHHPRSRGSRPHARRLAQSSRPLEAHDITQDVCLRHDANEGVSLDHREATDLALKHQAGRFLGGGLRRDRNGGLTHHLFDPERPQ